MYHPAQFPQQGAGTNRKALENMTPTRLLSRRALSGVAALALS
jgi:hypothetical protein